VLLLGIPYALALGDEQQMMEEERQRGMMAEGAQGMMEGGETKPAL
jgi:Mitochondrial import receptor subunit Tom22